MADEEGAGTAAGRLVWRMANFRRLWFAQTVSLFGSQITELALPLTAIFLLDAGAAELGLLGVARFLPFLLFPPFAGRMVDARRKRPLMITADLVRAGALAAAVSLAVTGLLTMGLLYVAAFIVGAGTVVFNLAYRSFLLSVVDRGQLVAGNSSLQASESTAQAAGPGLGGVLVNWLGAATALAADALSFLLSALALKGIKAEETPTPPTEQRGLRAWWRQTAAGFKITLHDRVMRATAIGSVLYNVFETALLTLLLLFATQVAGLSGAKIGVAISFGGLGALAGAAMAGPLARVIGNGPATIAGTILAALPLGTIAFAGGGSTAVMFFIGALLFVNGIGLGLSNVLAVSIRQALVPEHILGRANAAYMMLSYGSIPLGSLLGGYLGETIDLRIAIAVTGFAALTSVPWEIFSPLRRMRDLPQPADHLR